MTQKYTTHGWYAAVRACCMATARAAVDTGNGVMGEPGGDEAGYTEGVVGRAVTRSLFRWSAGKGGGWAVGLPSRAGTGGGARRCAAKSYENSPTGGPAKRSTTQRKRKQTYEKRRSRYKRGEEADTREEIRRSRYKRREEADTREEKKQVQEKRRSRRNNQYT